MLQSDVPLLVLMIHLLLSFFGSLNSIWLEYIVRNVARANQEHKIAVSILPQVLPKRHAVGKHELVFAV